MWHVLSPKEKEVEKKDGVFASSVYLHDFIPNALLLRYVGFFL